MSRCDLGVGCEDAGVCYADAHGEPARCGRKGQTVTKVKEPPVLCPACGKAAKCSHALMSNPPIYVYTCGCRVGHA